MPTWGEILREIQETANAGEGRLDFDGVRRRYLAQLNARTGNDTIIYYTDFFQSSNPAVMMTLEDMQAMMEVCKGLKGPGLDLIIHSPGGSPEAAASLVRYLRGRFQTIRVFVPLAAMSAATMWALAGDEIVMGAHSQLGPVDPQMILNGSQWPAQAILNQFERAKREIEQDANNLLPWSPALQSYAPALLELCEIAQVLAYELVAEWLEKYMFAGRRYRRRWASEAAEYFADYEEHKSHSMGISRDDARKRRIEVADLEEDSALQDAVLSVHHAAMHTLNGSALKVIENHLGKAFVKSEQRQVLQLAGPLPGPGGVPPETSHR